MMTEEQRGRWFTYHAPTPETGPKYTEIRDAEQAFIANVTQTSYENVQTAALYQEINHSAQHMAETIDRLAPDGSDKAAAIRCVRLARNLFNEWATQRSLPASQRAWHNILHLFEHAELELLKARMQANSAIACGGV